MTKRGDGAKRRERSAASLDAVDHKMLDILRDDGRISIAALAEAVGVSRANAYARLERLRNEGVIEGFTVKVNHARLGLGVTAMSLVRVRQPAREHLAGPLNEIPGIEYASFVTGEHDVVILMRAPDVETLHKEIMTSVSRQDTVRSLHTILVLDEIVRRPFVVPPEEWRR